MEKQIGAFLGSGDLELPHHLILVYPNPHGGKFGCTLQNSVPDDDITIQSFISIHGFSTPVIIVRSAPVVGFTVGQVCSDPNNEYGAKFLCNFILAFLAGQIGILFIKLLGMDEADFLGQLRHDDRIESMEEKFTSLHIIPHLPDCIFQCIQGSLAGQNGFFPIPLVHIYRMQVIQLLIGSECIHIGIDTIAGPNIIVPQHHPLPFCKRHYNFSFFVSKIFHLEANGFLKSVKVIIQPGPFQHKKWGCNPS